MEKGRKYHAAGIGGKWPARRFSGMAQIVVLAEDVNTGDRTPIALELPELSVLAPFARKRGDALDEAWGPIPPFSRSLQGKRASLLAAPAMEPLFGRDVFYASDLGLNWNPRKDSWILLPEIAVRDERVEPERA